MKKCFKCQKKKPLSSFYKHSRMADGLLGKCKECCKKDVADNYRANREHYAEYERKRFLRPERKLAASLYQKLRKKRNPGKERARYAVSNALRDGRLERLACEICGETKSQAHHEDYRKPLSVRWLCRPHHLEAHGKVAY